MKGPVKPSLLIFYDHFFPAYKAGGPIQSLTNLAIALQDVYGIFVITSSYDLNEARPLENIQPEVWSEITIPGSASSIKVWYAAAGKPGTDTIKENLKRTGATVVYLNGMFSYRYVLVPLFAIKKNIRIVICPRGMLQQGALAVKSFKKKIYLAILKMSGLCKRVTWHATNAEEEQDIKKVFGSDAKVIVAENIPKKPVAAIRNSGKQQGTLRLVYLSLITEKKNLLLLVNIISKLPANITLDIYGPVKDAAYWRKCEEVINTNSSKIKYRGDVKPADVQETFANYDASILLTKGENFGHALYESLSAGRPIITSNFTPWNGLQEKKAGWNVDISNEKEISETLLHICNMNNAPFNEYQTGAHNIASDYYLHGFDTGKYLKLFSE
ncbi:MAG: glycosyltransferase [Ferruginibacter sp.]